MSTGGNAITLAEQDAGVSPTGRQCLLVLLRPQLALAFAGRGICGAFAGRTELPPNKSSIGETLRVSSAGRKEMCPGVPPNASNF